MALLELGKQLAQQAILDAATGKEDEKKSAPAAAHADSTAAVIFGQIAAMQKALKDDEELAVYFGAGTDRIRVMEMFQPSPQVVVMTGIDANRALTRVVSAAQVLQLVCKTGKVASGAKPARVALLTPKSKDSNS
ncbi:MAG TPA: hypothetical protein VN736_11400 [Candidatus Limnocylindrales bacterium]|nr:hypothetical protein [Candidatus Limnocylindrales bacterium]